MVSLSLILVTNLAKLIMDNKHILRDMPKGTKLYFENQDINSIIEGFKFLISIFFEIFLNGLYVFNETQFLHT